MAVLDRDIWSLWAQDKDGGWSMLNSGQDRNALERQASSLKPIFLHKTFIIVSGTNCPR